MKNNNLVVLAYSGGLDTSFCIPYLREKGYDVHAIYADTSGIEKAEVEKLESNALNLGASYFECVDVSTEYYHKCIRYLVYGNILRGNVYPLSVSAERTFQAQAVLNYVLKSGAKYVAHGSTGAGNDQVRFDLMFRSIAPDVEIITPIRDHGYSREEEVAYLEERGYQVSKDKKDYSINKGLWGTSVGGKETLTSHLPLPDHAYPTAIVEDNPQKISLSFSKGEVCGLNGQKMDPIELIKKLDRIGGSYGIGRDIHVGDTIIGIKGRVGFEAAAAHLIIKAHEALEKHTLSKWQQHWKKQLGDWYGMQLHEGQYMDPSMRDIEKFLESTQHTVSGEVYLTLYPRTFSIDGITSDYDLMNSSFGAYGEENTAWSGEDVKGFINIMANAHQIYYHTQNQNAQADE